MELGFEVKTEAIDIVIKMGVEVNLRLKPPALCFSWVLRWKVKPENINIVQQLGIEV